MHLYKYLSLILFTKSFQLARILFHKFLTKQKKVKNMNNTINHRINLLPAYSINTNPSLQMNKLRKITNDTVSFSAKDSDQTATGLFTDKKYTINSSLGLTKRKISGKIGEDLDFNISHNGKFFKADTLTGNINEKPLNLKVSSNMFSKAITGTIGKDTVDLKVKDTWSGYSIKGKFKENDVDIKLNSKFIGYSLESDKMSLRIKDKSLFGNDVNIQGSYKDDPDMIPILMDLVYCLRNEEEMAMML